MAVLWLTLAHYYTKISGFIAYIFAVGVAVDHRFRLSAAEVNFILALTLLFLFQLLFKDSLTALADFRFYWGWMIFYLIFRLRSIEFRDLSLALTVLSIATVVEMLLVNTVISATILPNYPDAATTRTVFVGEGYYQRPYSFGGNATVGSSILAALIAMCRPKGWRLWLAIFAILTFSSGTGLLALAAALLVRYRTWLKVAAVPLAGVLVLLTVVVVSSDDIRRLFAVPLSKLDPSYFTMLINLKWSQIAGAYQNVDWYGLIFGDPAAVRGGDFGFLGFSATNGILGLSLFFVFTINRLRRETTLPILLLLGTSFHYPVLFFFPGQMLFGLLLAMSANTEARLGNTHEPRSC